jgi:DNA-directed RNA polymerase specialized sigma24 family protein
VITGPQNRYEPPSHVAADSPELPHNACICSLRLLEALPANYAEVLRRVDLQGEPTEAAAVTLSISVANSTCASTDPGRAHSAAS